MKVVPDKRIDELIFMQPHLRILLVGKVGETDENVINYNSKANQLQINNPLLNWTKEDMWIFASSLYLSYNSIT